MAVNLADSGPKMDWTRDNRIYDRFSTWKTNVENVILTQFLQTINPNRKLHFSDYGLEMSHIHWYRNGFLQEN